jgi:transposase
MPPNFIACDRDQAYLMPPSLLDWVPGDHLVWSILGSVDELDLSAFYADYRVDGHGRPAYDPKMMVALLLYAYARGNRSSRGIERACREGVAVLRENRRSASMVTRASHKLSKAFSPMRRIPCRGVSAPSTGGRNHEQGTS